MDIFTKEKRSRIMSLIRSKNTKLELRLRRCLWQKGARYRVHYRLIGKPDIVFSREKIAIFVDGCFWHKCPKCYRPPLSNVEFWTSKIEKNAQRDKEQMKALRGKGWRVLRFWEHEIEKDVGECAERSLKARGGRKTARA